MIIGKYTIPDALKSSVGTGRGLSGKGVYIGFGDDGNITTHADHQDRIIDRCGYAVTNHATHTAGTAIGAGLLNPRHEGFANKATVISEHFTNIIGSADAHVSDFNMVLTNNSYTSAASGCTGNGDYGFYASYTDDRVEYLRSLLMFSPREMMVA
jgi:subtilisin family serine protease